METLDRTFRPRIGWITLIFGIVTAAVVFLFELVNTTFAASPTWIENLAGWAFAGYLLAAGIGLSGLFLSRLRLECDGTEFVVTTSIFSTILFRKSVKGISWHTIATASGSLEHGVEGEGLYRVEISGGEGERTVVLGALACWLYGIHCL